MSFDFGLGGKIQGFPGDNHVVKGRVDFVENCRQFGLDDSSDFGRVRWWTQIHGLEGRIHVVICSAAGAKECRRIN